MTNNIDKQYDELLKMGDKIAEDFNNDEPLSDEEIEEIFEAIEGQKTDPAQLFPSNNGIEENTKNDPEQNVTEQVLVSTTHNGLLNTIPYKKENISEADLDEILNLENEDLKKIEIGKDAFDQQVKSMYPDATPDDLKQLLVCVNKYRQGIKFPYFNELPETMKKEINNYVNAGVTQYQAANNTVRQLKNALAKELFDTIITNNYSTKAFSDLSEYTISEINKNKEEFNESVKEYNSKLRQEYEVGFLEKAKLLEESDEEGAAETAEKLRKASRMFTQSYTYEDMYEAYKNYKIKIKPIQLDKFKRTCEEFNSKYYNNTFKIRDIMSTIPVLDRKLDKKYDIKVIHKFIVAFINYTRYFSPSNIDEHIFMFYFIQNILSLDIDIPGDDYENFNNLVKENIYKFLDLIIERDNK